MRTLKNRLRALVKAAKNGSLKLKSGTKIWRVYELNINELVWGRNLVDGWDIDVYMFNKRGHKDHIGSIKVDGNLQKTELYDGDELIETFNYSV